MVWAGRASRFLRRSLLGALIATSVVLLPLLPTPATAQGLDRLLQELLTPHQPIRRIDPQQRSQPRERQQVQGTRLNPQSVRSTQVMLNGLGYDAGEPDGAFGARTLRALNQFQRDYGLPLSRTLDQQSLATLSAVYQRSNQPGRADQEAEYEPREPAYEPAIPTGEPGFDCRRATARDERAICASATLRRLDSQLNADYQRLVSDSSAADARHWRNSQRAFLKKRRACGRNTSCLTQIYEDRIAELGSMPADSQEPSDFAGDGPAMQASGVPLSPELDELLPDLPRHHGLPATDRFQPSNEQGIGYLIALLRLGQYPDILTDDATAQLYARDYLRDERRNALLGAYGGWAGANEFEQIRSYEEFVARDAERLREIAPKLPLTVVLTDSLMLEQYDRERGAFPLQSHSGTVMQLPDMSRSVAPQFAVPDFLAADSAAAEDLVTRAENRSLWMAATVTITRIGKQPGDLSYRLERLLGYADRQLTDLVYEFPVEQAPVAGSEGENVAASSSVPVMGDTVFLAELNAGISPAKSIDWAREARTRLEIERKIYGIDRGANWKEHDPWGPFFPASAKDAAGQEAAFEEWTRKRAETLPKNLVIRSWASLRLDGSGGSEDIDADSGVPAVAERITLSTFYVPYEAAGVGTTTERRGFDELIGRTVGGSADRLIFVSRGDYFEPGALLFDRPVRDYRFPVDVSRLTAAVRKLPEKDYRRFDVLLTVERGEARRLKHGEVELTVLPVTPKSVALLVGGEVVATGSFDASGGVRYGVGDQTVNAPAGKAMQLDAETMDLLTVKYVPQSITDQDWERMLWSRFRVEKSVEKQYVSWGEFFRNVTLEPDAKDIPALLDDFKTWSASRAAKLPGQFTVSIPRPQGTLFRLPSVWKTELRSQSENRIQDCRYSPDTDLAECDRLEASLDMQDRTVELRPRSGCAYHDAYCHASLQILRKQDEGASPVDLFELTQQVETLLPPSDGRSRNVQLTIAISGARVADKLRPSVFAEAGWKVEGPSVKLPAPVFEAKLLSAALVEPDTHKVVQPLAVGPIRLNLPKRKEEESRGSVYDIIGIKLGDSFEAAEAIIRKHMEVGRVFEGIRKHDGSVERGMVTPATSGKLFVSPDGREMIGLIDEPPAIDGRVAAAWRRIYFEPATVPEPEINESLRQKYGNPFTGQMESSHNVWFAGGKAVKCSQQDYIFNTQMQALSASWTDGNPAPTLVMADRSIVHDAKLPKRMRDPLERSASRQPDCGEVISSETRFEASRSLKAGYPSGSMDWVETILTDADAYAKAFAENRAAAQKAAGDGSAGTGKGVGVKF